MTTSFQSIPLVDVAPAYGGSESARDRLAAELRDVLSRVGFAYIANHQVPQDLVEGVRDQARRFFDLPVGAKKAVAINPAHRGYMSLASSTIVTSSVAEVTKPNQSESLLVMHELAGADLERLADQPLQGPNQWPRELPALREISLAYMAAMEGLARPLVRLIARGLGLGENHFEPHFEKPTVFLRLLHYPPQPAEEGLFGSAPHTDYGFLTLLAQDDVGGLEVRNLQGEWIPAPPIADTFVLNVGDILSRWTGGAFASTPHRVVNLSGRERYSQPYFFDPSMDCVVAPLTGPGAGEFPPVRYGDYLMERIDRNYDYRSRLRS
jgi:isopenicillin N synthase-like dioxygenase